MLREQNNTAATSLPIHNLHETPETNSDRRNHIEGYVTITR